VTTRGEGASAKLVWLDLDAPSDAEGTGWAEIARTGDTRGACGPSFSHDGSTIVYTSTQPHDGRMDQGPSDLRLVPYADRAGGTSTPLGGAADPAFDEYYPAFSPDDALVAFNRVPAGLSTLYNQPAVEVFVVPAAGGTATRLVANDPPGCAGRTSPGVQNSWPKWAPEAPEAGGKTYYFMIFSSIRAATAKVLDSASCPVGQSRGDTCRSQLFMTAVTRDAAGEVESFGSIYLWNQDASTNNLTPAWDVFKIPDFVPK
jgi:hypothetical protein